jgi:hypothetical protein
MARPPSIQWYYKQWLGDNKVLAMDWDARGMHFHLLMISIQEEPPGSLPDDMNAIRRWLTLPSGSVDADQTWRRVKPQILAAWSLQNSRWYNSGMVETMERQERYRDRYEESTKRKSKSRKREIVVDNKNQSTLFEEAPIIKNLAPLIEEVGRLHPANAHLRTRDLPEVQQQLIAEAINRDGYDAVFAGTRNLAERVLQWPPSDMRFIPNPVKFYREGEYQKNPALWERRKDNANATEDCSRHPGARRTQSGECWECYSTRYVSGCQSA